MNVQFSALKKFRSRKIRPHVRVNKHGHIGDIIAYIEKLHDGRWEILASWDTNALPKQLDNRIFTTLEEAKAAILAA